LKSKDIYATKTMQSNQISVPLILKDTK
jgi:hypothetical protein